MKETEHSLRIYVINAAFVTWLLETPLHWTERCSGNAIEESGSTLGHIIGYHECSFLSFPAVSSDIPRRPPPFKSLVSQHTLSSPIVPFLRVTTFLSRTSPCYKHKTCPHVGTQERMN
jgi:hypothetical protein